MLEDCGLILEGGGMRGVFTCGVLDCFMDYGVKFPYAIGVSAGASNGLSYVSQQRGRARFCNIDILRRRHYIGLRYLFTQGCVMDYKFLFGELPLKVCPYDFAAYKKSKTNFLIVATNCQTGKAEYFSKSQTESDLLAKCKASCSLPFVCKKTLVDGKYYLDGGIADPLPIEKAILDGYKKNVVVLTRNYGYRKSEKPPFLPKFVYSDYPKLREAFLTRTRRYNQKMQKIEQLEKSGQITVIRPQNKLVINRLESDPDKLRLLYEEGYVFAKDFCKKLCSEK